MNFRITAQVTLEVEIEVEAENYMQARWYVNRNSLQEIVMLTGSPPFKLLKHNPSTQYARVIQCEKVPETEPKT